MKKTIAVAVFLFTVVVSDTFAQTTADEWFKKAGEYFDKGDYANAVTAFSEVIKRNSIDLDAYWFRSYAYYKIKNYDAAIADCNTVIKGAPDFPTVYVVRGDAYGAKGIYHKAVADYKIGLEKGFDPSEFNVDKPRNVVMWFYGSMYMEIVVNRFLGKSDVVTKYENWLKIVCDRNKVTPAEIDAYYRNGIRGFIAEIVDEEFNKISFTLTNLSADRAYNTVLTRNPQTGEYTLSYERPSVQNSRKELTVQTLDALLATMRNSKTDNRPDFVRSDIDTVSAQAKLIPAVAFSTAEIQTIKNELTDFYLNPNRDTLLVLQQRYRRLSLAERERGVVASTALHEIVFSLNPELARRVTTNN